VNEPRWLTRQVALALHDESLRTFGGSPGVRDEGLLESALARPRNAFVDGAASQIPALAAVGAWGLCRNHPFVDGNERIAALGMAVFSAMNGWRFDPDQVDEVRAIRALAAGEFTEPDFAVWVAVCSSPRQAP
jgi:death-on-curing protein